MSAYDNALMFVCAVLLLYLPWRLFKLVRLKTEDRRFFAAFWLWPLLWFLLMNLVPKWGCRGWLFQVATFFFMGGSLLDFLYFYGIRTETAKKQQVLSGLLLLPCLLVTGRHWADGESLPLYVPYYGEALVWTDNLFSPKTWYFMDPDTNTTDIPEELHDDPNYAKAVFAPMDGTLDAIEDGYLKISKDGVSITLGPMLADSLRLKAGDAITSQMPLGLMGRSASIPGLRMTVNAEGAVRFQEAYSGRWWAPKSDLAIVRRNDKILSEAKGGFKLRPVTQ